MTTQIYNKEMILNQIEGGTFFGTGGGLPRDISKSIFDSAFNIKKEIEVIDVNDIDDNDILLSAYGVGDPADATSVESDFIKQVMRYYEKLTGYFPRAIIPGEINAESLSFLIAAILDLPVVNSDLVGGRAAPEIQMDCFTLFNKPLTPTLGVAMNNKKLFLDGGFDAVEIEEIYRSFFAKNGNLGQMVGYPIKAKEYKKIGMKDTITDTQKVGKLLLDNKLDEVLKKYNGKILVNGKLSKENLGTKDGFTQGFIWIDDFVVKVKNENMSVTKDSKILSRAPEIIILLDDNNRPIHNSSIKNYLGKNISICILEAQGYWRESDFSKIWDESVES